MKKVVLKRVKLLLFVLFIANATLAQKMDRTNAYYYNKNGQYNQAVQSIEKCINHPNFSGWSSKDQAQAWLYRAVIYVNVSRLDHSSTLYPNALAIAYQSLQSCINTDANYAKENEYDIQSMLDYINSITSNKPSQNSTNTNNRTTGKSQNTGNLTVQQAQWEFYNTIPNFKNISFLFDKPDVWEGSEMYQPPKMGKGNDGDKLSLTIYDDYTVSLRYTSSIPLEKDESSSISVSIIGKGMLQWKNERMVLNMEVTTKSNGGVENKIGQFVNRDDRYEAYQNDYSFSPYEKTDTYTYILTYNETDRGGCFELSGNDIESTIYGKISHWYDGAITWEQPWGYKACIKLTGRPFGISVVEKSQSELNAQTSDMYGKWQWNDDRSVIYLESTTKDAFLVLWNNNGNLSWGFQLNSAASGYKTETAESGAELAYLMLTFDGGAEQSFTFEKTVSSSTMAEFQYVQYDRFLGNLKHDASILGQIKDKRIMIVNYKQNGSSKTAMFQLEGLEAIYNAITQ